MPTELEAPMRAKGMVHKQIADTAKGLAEAHYEVLAKDNRFYRKYPDVKRFVRLKWELYITLARQTLVGMLGAPDSQVSPEMKEAIAEAVLKDGTINPKKMAAPQKPSFFLK